MYKESALFISCSVPGLH